MVFVHWLPPDANIRLCCQKGNDGVGNVGELTLLNVKTSAKLLRQLRYFYSC